MERHVVQGAKFITNHYGYYRLRFNDPREMHEGTYVIFKGNLYSHLRPITVVHSESEAVGKCKLLEKNNYK